MKITLTFQPALAAFTIAGLSALMAQDAPSEDDLARDNKLFITLASSVLKWEEPAEPVKIAGPLYFVGTLTDWKCSRK